MINKRITRNATRDSNGVRDGTYRIFLLACWLETEDDRHDPESWRFRLEEPRSGWRRGCIGVKRLVTLLCDEIADETEDLMSEIDSNN